LVYCGRLLEVRVGVAIAASRGREQQKAERGAAGHDVPPREERRWTLARQVLRGRFPAVVRSGWSEVGGDADGVALQIPPEQTAPRGGQHRRGHVETAGQVGVAIDVRISLDAAGIQLIATNSRARRAGPGAR